MADWLVSPFLDYGFMQRALFGSVLLSVSSAPVGVFLMVRRMSLTGDAMSHAILPGAALGFLLFGLDVLSMTIGGLLIGLLVALGSGLVSRFTVQKEDASMAAFYLISLAVGVLLVSWHGSSVDLMHVLFGSVLALNDEALTLITGIALLTFLAFALLWRGLVAECLDPLFLRSVSRIGGPVHLVFLVLVVLNLVGGFQALGTLLSVGLMMLPAVAARFWSNDLRSLCLIAMGFAVLSSLGGLLLSFHAAMPSGPAIIFVAGGLYLASALIGRRGMLQSLLRGTRHRTA
ncbi:zinc ABC transporter permease AztB [Rhizobium sp. CC-YZS058]|uniref:zinc ABC transporter permease AztB n=1 Tax=Rhizobium sp. CC-YZS058 TaxID=3042153 RepID=UPI002B05A55D|nr:zinc ABC transporter permease AztB [Rhizobium sp. CC-YZS058]MEA3536685.1 zinc ABC transporter permease AztB [Rhizobium sp. CC-YZS058]